MTRPLFLLSGYWKELFVVNGSEEGTLLSLLPVIITAVCIGVMLAGIWFTLTRALESYFLSHLVSAPATEQGTTLTEMGLDPNSKKARLLLWLLRRPSCSLYRFISHTEKVRHDEALSRLAEGTSPVANEKAQESGDGDSCEAQNTAQGARALKRARRRAFREGARGYTLSPDTRYFLLPGEIDRAQQRAKDFGSSSWMSLIYTLLFSAGVWFALLNVLDRLVAFFVG